MLQLLFFVLVFLLLRFPFVPYFVFRFLLRSPPVFLLLVLTRVHWLLLSRLLSPALTPVLVRLLSLTLPLPHAPALPPALRPAPWFLRPSSYLSASPITGSMLPMTATISEIIPPFNMIGSVERLQVEGERIFMRHGFPVPSDTR
jgi:hypothetical protein